VTVARVAGAFGTLLLLAVGCVSAEKKRAHEPAPAATQMAFIDEAGRQWAALGADGIRDPESPAIAYLQQPGEALSVLPDAIEGNQVDWVKALADGAIKPRSSIDPKFEVRRLDLDVLMTHTAGIPMVRFPHRQHTEWLDCSNCHDKIFKKKAGTSGTNMLAILQGEFCGQCHGAVAFPLTQCRRCHSVERSAQAADPPLWGGKAP
jgi:c(7)-type cytochrome triheme protein